ncbi:hypothetical protein E2C01_063035 [Portunus trituberculatus]|uniref:Uncharacterized protein n=1 Tax=Portunus trituberculatus TaxID=210409 RepID=A0A5B7HH14_PORTR|nr:hypothetical protein [Portunus trituberculatus]
MTGDFLADHSACRSESPGHCRYHSSNLYPSASPRAESIKDSVIEPVCLYKPIQAIKGAEYAGYCYGTAPADHHTRPPQQLPRGSTVTLAGGT